MQRAVVTLVLVTFLLPAAASAREQGLIRGQAPGAWAVRKGLMRSLGKRVVRVIARPAKATGRHLRRASLQVKVLRKQALKLKMERAGLHSLSTSTLLLGSTGRVLNLTRAVGPFTGPILGIGSLGLGYVSARDFIHAQNTRKRAEALHGVAWSMQGLTSLGFALQGKFSWLGPTSKTLGVAGGALQTGVGIWRLGLGIKHHQKERIVLGALDMGGGVCWAASACSLATPWTLGGFVAFTTARMAYEHRDFLRVASRKLRKKVQSRARRVRRKVRVKMGRMTGRLRRFLKRREIRRPQSPPMQTLPSSPTPQ